MIASVDPFYRFVLGQVIARLREQHGMTQRKLAAQIGVHQSVLSRIEAGQVPDAVTLKQIADAVGLTVDTVHGLACGGLEGVHHVLRETGAPPADVLGRKGAAEGLAAFVVAMMAASA